MSTGCSGYPPRASTSPSQTELNPRGSKSSAAGGMMSRAHTAAGQT